MPYIIKKVNEGYKVCKKDGSKCFSNHPIPLSHAKKQLKAIGMHGHLKGGNNKNDILNELKKLKFLYIVGSVNRNEENDFNDLDFITEKDLKECFEQIKSIFPDANLITKGTKYIKIKIGNLNIDIWKAENNEELKAMRILRTVDKAHNIAYRKQAKKWDLKLNDKGLFFNDGERIPFINEIELREILGFT